MANERLDARIDSLSRRVTKVDHKLSDKIDNLAIQTAVLTGKVDVLISQNSAMIEMLEKALGLSGVIDPAKAIRP